MKIRNLLLFGSLTAFLVGGNINLSAQTSDNERQAKAFDRTVKRVGNRNDFRLNAQLTSISKQQNAVHKSAKKEQGDNIYFEDFANEVGFGNFVVVNSNEDDKTWELATGEQKTCARYNTHATNFADDWLITPKITLPGGRMYTLTFKAASRGPFYPEALEVKWGTGQTVADMKNTLLTKTEIKTERNQWTEFEYNIKATEDMDIYVGFHAVSNPNSFTLYVTDITVDNGRDLNAPDKVTDFTVIPDMAGAAKATVKFKTPTKTIGGGSLTQIDKVNVYRDGEMIKEISYNISDPSTGIEVSLEDMLPNVGTYSWTVKTYGTYGESLPATISKYIGEDIPARPENMKMVDNGDNTATATWDPVTIGANGGFVNVEKLYYKIYNVIDGKIGEQIDEVNEPTVTSSDLNIDNGIARTEYLVVSAENKAGEGDVAIGMLIAGKPTQMPYRESFSSSNGTDNFIWTQAVGNSEMDLIDELSSDGDNSALAYMSMNIGDQNWINTEKISFQAVKKPVLTFDVHPGDPAGFEGNVTVKVEANVGQTGAPDIELYSVNLSELTSCDWNKVSVDLSQLVGEKYAILKLHFIANDVYQFVYLDNIQIEDVIDHNIALTMSVPSEVIVQNPAVIEVNIANTGVKDIEAGQTVDIFVNDALVKTFTTEALTAKTGTQTLNYSYSPAINEGDELKVKALVNYAEDEIENDNEANAVIEIIPNAVPTVNVSIDGTESDITLSWNKPDLYQLGTVVTEDFDDETVYEPFSTGGIDLSSEYGMIGDWFMWDADGIHTFTFANHDSYPNATGIMAWQVFKPESVFDFNGADAASADIYAPHSGKQYMAAFGSEIFGGVVESDNWLVSPQLDRSQQTITFWTKLFNKNYTPETIEVRYATEDVDWADYRLLTTINQVDDKWTERTVTLPYGTMFFALRHTSANKFVVVVDDITYRNANSSGEGDAMSIIGYRIYRDGELMSTIGPNEVSYTDKNVPEGEHIYNVSVLYSPDIESPMSNTVSITGIESLTVESENISIYAADGRLVANDKNAIDNLKAGVYILKDNTTGKSTAVVKK